MSDFSICSLLMIFTFVMGYFLITIEHVSQMSKTAIALIMAILCWICLFVNQVELHETHLTHLSEHLANVSEVILFLLCALTIMEIINAHKGFQLISRYISIRSKRQLLWSIGVITFFLSAVLDNLTTTIMMVTLLRKLTDEGEDRLLLGGAVVIAANAGGAWTPIGDVTTTMLWIGGQLSTLTIIKTLFLPSLACLVVALLCLSFYLKGDFILSIPEKTEKIEPMGKAIFCLGIGSLLFVPFFKIVTGLPPFMGILLGLGAIWLFTDFVHGRHPNREHLRVPQIIARIDLSGILFFLGILLCIDALHTAGHLNHLAQWMNQKIAHPHTIAIAIGLGSAIVDNVPLVAAVMGMYELSQHPMDSAFWNLIAYCAGTGGSILVIGSAAGVAFMGLERVQFLWYLQRIGLAALVGYFAGIGVFQLMT